MATRRWLLLKAINQNWCCTGPGDWTEVIWRIFNDGSYEIVSCFNPSDDALREMLNTKKKPKPVKKKAIGSMDEAAFSKLLVVLKCDPWRDPSVDDSAYDGEAWDIKMFKEDGSIDKTSGNLNYIYGHRVLETIVSCLPIGLQSREPG